MGDLVDFAVVQRVAFILDKCGGKRVLHLGCTNHPYTAESIKHDMLLHAEIERKAASLAGIDSEQDSLALLEKAGFQHLFTGDLEKLDDLDIEGEFDIIVAGEMIEHLNNPGLFLDGIKRFMHKDTKLILTTINAYCGMRFLWYGLRGKRGRNEFVHPDHVAYYSYSTLNKLLERHALHVENFFFYDIGKEHRPHNRWFLNILNDVFVRLAPQWADGIVAVCRLR
ncbi:MAG: methyltransferase domain-containing protein [Pyrinomonadaceae bacterium]